MLSEKPDGPLAARNLGISIIHQEFNLCAHLTVAQNIFIGREHRKGWLLDVPAVLVTGDNINRKDIQAIISSSG